MGNGKDEVVRLLIQRGADIHVKTNKGSTPLNIAKQMNHSSSAAILEAAMNPTKVTRGIRNRNTACASKNSKPEKRTTLQHIETKAAKILESLNNTIQIQEDEESNLETSHDDKVNDAISKLPNGNRNTRAAVRSIKMAKLYKLEQDKIGRAIEMMHSQILQVKSTLNQARFVGKMKPAAAQDGIQSSTTSNQKSMSTLLQELHDTDYYSQQVEQILSEKVHVAQSDQDLLLELQEMMGTSESTFSPPPPPPPVPTAPPMDP